MLLNSSVLKQYDWKSFLHHSEKQICGSFNKLPYDTLNVISEHSVQVELNHPGFFCRACNYVFRHNIR